MTTREQWEKMLIGVEAALMDAECVLEDHGACRGCPICRHAKKLKLLLERESSALKADAPPEALADLEEWLNPAEWVPSLIPAPTVRA